MQSNNLVHAHATTDTIHPFDARGIVKRYHHTANQTQEAIVIDFIITVA